MELPSLAPFALLLQSKPDDPIIVRITEPARSEFSALSQVLLGSLGLSGALALMAISLGIGIGGLMFWLKRRSG
jgi:hypothetical protein